MVRPPLRSLLLGRLVTLIGDKPAGHDVYFSSILFSMSGAVEVYVSRQPFFSRPSLWHFGRRRNVSTPNNWKRKPL